MSEWDVFDRGYLDFEALLSIVATYLKIEELDLSIEEDFLTMCGISLNDQRKMTSEEKEKAEISPQMLYNAVNKFGTKRMKKNFTIHHAEEMVYDADLQHEDNKISIDELVTCLEMVGDKEMLEDSAAKRALWHAPSGRHLADKKKQHEHRKWEETRALFRSDSEEGKRRAYGDSWDQKDKHHSKARSETAFVVSSPKLSGTHQVLRTALESIND